MGKIRYICTKCGGGFTTRAAANRHVRTVENGAGTVVTEPEFRIGLIRGVFQPAPSGKRPRYKKDPPDLMAIAGEEYDKGFWRRFGELEGEAAFKDPKRRPELSQLMQLHRMKQISQLYSSDQ